MDRMDVGEFQEEIRKDFRALARMFEINFNHISVERLALLKIKISDLIDLLTIKIRQKH